MYAVDKFNIFIYLQDICEIFSLFYASSFVYYAMFGFVQEEKRFYENCTENHI